MAISQITIFCEQQNYVHYVTCFFNHTVIDLQILQPVAGPALQTPFSLTIHQTHPILSMVATF